MGRVVGVGGVMVLGEFDNGEGVGSVVGVGGNVVLTTSASL